MAFLLRLKEAIQKTVSHPDLQDLLMQTLSLKNANVECQKILWPLKAQNAPLDEYIKACLEVGSEPYKAHLLATALKRYIKTK